MTYVKGGVDFALKDCPQPSKSPKLKRTFEGLLRRPLAVLLNFLVLDQDNVGVASLPIHRILLRSLL